MKKKSGLKSFWSLSIIATIIFAFIPKVGIRIEGHYYYFGFPANCLIYYKGPRLTPDIIGIVFNIAFFYFVFFILNKIFNKILRSTIR
ncbi:hypothetical protein P4629_10525 [Priestia aryabhattai]|uniref:hypothetical protein n=1 Tax=Priestia aryabhattai TaxID=412384 RepID=UPI001FB32570|nr:hypothetical protein [Priestia aryabhattai]MCL9635870.1 hypothetical protein [Bacillus zanthoxyli]MED3959103.1 hypothetical protein [Priestia aryabhattai]MED4005848.1 hypothetical protein [Priestia aryabhattai]